MIIVFGAAGFIGTYLIDQLIKENYSVIAADLSDFGASYYENIGIPYYHIDITDKTSLDKLPTESIEAVINLACIQPANVSASKYDPTDYFKVNVIGTLNLLGFCSKNSVRKYFYTSSHRNTQGFWKEKEGTAIKESDGRSIKYTGDYAVFSISESAAVDCILHYNQAFGLKGVIFRLPPVYGYGPHTEIYKDGKPLKTGFQIFIDNALQGKPLEVWGDSTRGRDIIYVKDVVSAFVLALKKGDITGLYNISSGKASTLKEEAESIAHEFWPQGSRPEFVFLPEKSNNIEAYFYDISKAKEDFGWAPEYSFAEMIADYRKEMDTGRFSYLVEKRKRMMSENDEVSMKK
ncbi:MAG: NAD(P)-dependent oxidoreductase [Eubacteriales bacterium]|nr:NAD(P)-dependent oxidoreductase [Eubacteriales bacterium]